MQNESGTQSDCLGALCRGLCPLIKKRRLEANPVGRAENGSILRRCALTSGGACHLSPSSSKDGAA